MLGIDILSGQDNIYKKCFHIIILVHNDLIIQPVEIGVDDRSISCTIHVSCNCFIVYNTTIHIIHI